MNNLPKFWYFISFIGFLVVVGITQRDNKNISDVQSEISSSAYLGSDCNVKL